MNNNNYQTKKQPKLRFKNLNTYIKQYYCSDISNIHGAGVDKVIREDEILVDIINFTDVFNNRFLDKNYQFQKSSCSKKELLKYKVENGDILITPSSENKHDIGLASAILFDKKNIVYSYHLNLIRFDKEKVDPLWASYYFSTKYIRKYFYKISSGITRYTLSKKDLEKIEIILPQMNEQNQIAKFLSLLDKQIDLYVRKLELTNKIKIYYLNNIFSNKNIPNLRFIGFDKKNIKEFKIKELTSFMKSGGTPKSGAKEYYSDLGYNFISIEDMDKKYLVSSKKFITEKALNETSTFLFEKNNLLFSIYATIGNISINKIDVALPQSILGIKPNNKVLIEYFYYLLLFNKRKIVKFQQVGSQPNLSLKIFESIKILVTENKIEQEKIATLMSLLDKKIENLLFKKDICEKMKKYYLNNLFI